MNIIEYVYGNGFILNLIIEKIKIYELYYIKNII